MIVFYITFFCLHFSVKVPLFDRYIFCKGIFTISVKVVCFIVYIFCKGIYVRLVADTFFSFTTMISFFLLTVSTLFVLLYSMKFPILAVSANN